MSGPEQLALAVLTVWVAVLTLALASMIRELAILRLRFDRVGGDFSVDRAGLEVGRSVPPEVHAALPMTAEPLYALVMSASCSPCWQFLERFQVGPEIHLSVLLSGGGDKAAEMASKLPKHATVIRDPLAKQLAAALQVSSTPFVIQMEDGIVTGKSYLRRTEDFGRLVEARQQLGKPRRLPAQEVVPR